MERIGESLKRMGKIGPEQIQRITSLQDRGDRRLFGEIAVDLDFVSVGDLLYCLRDPRRIEHEVT